MNTKGFEKCKVFVAFRAREEILPRVTPLMDVKVRALGKAFATFRTIIWFLPCVSPLVSDKASLPTKTFITFRTVICRMGTCKGRLFGFIHVAAVFPARHF
ncbi:hypothetical protein XELAEV_18004036mg [Xenopus laevis]|uniref:Uncharacterized protein n=1 Tax=Xenopus laevis TaxID=8355 RepID=A0A974BPV6_XENLA|nr:hypothetical protein XELAEV_18004036mg [Xenopus laevis]